MLTAADMMADLSASVDAQVEDQHGAELGGGDWRQDPVDFDTFVESKAHLGLPPLFPRQRQAVTAIVGNDPKLMFAEGPRTELVTWQPVKSSNVKALAWHRDHLYVHYRTGTYRYLGVPEDLYTKLHGAKSVGKAIATHVKGRYEHTKLDGPVDHIDYIADDGRRYQTAVLLWGKGSGKDYLCSIILAYCAHVLLCLRDPQRYLRLAPGEAVDIINVAYNADQAKRVFFAKFKARLTSWRWLRDNFNVYESGRIIGERRAGLPNVEINDDWVQFPRMIRAFSRHSANESYEGFNVLVWIMDEASAFLSPAKRENAEAIWQTLKTSASSRFQQRWLGFIISYPRHGDDFTMTRHAEAQRNPELGMYADGPAATWDINRNAGRGRWVEVMPGKTVPVEFADDYILDFQEAMGRFECKPPAAKEALIRFPERLWQAVQDRPPLLDWEPTVTTRTVATPTGERQRRFRSVRITRMGKLPKGTRLFFHGDPGVSNDSFALGLCHGVPATIIVRVPASEVYDTAERQQLGLAADELIDWEKDVTRVIVDALIVWRPDPRQDMQVDLLNVREILKLVVKRYRIGVGSFDNWESEETVQWMQARKVPVENEQWSNQLQLTTYKLGRTLFYNDLISLPNHETITSRDPRAPGALYELERVELIEDRKIDHPDGGSKDLADAIVGAARNACTAPVSGFTYGSTLHGPGPTRPTHTKSPNRTVNPDRTPSPADNAALRSAEEHRQQERPEGELTEGHGTIRRKLAYGTIRRTP